jgi:hypothetical protein
MYIYFMESTMLMTRADLMALRSLAQCSEPVALDQIPASFRPEFERYFFGKTLVRKSGQLFAYPHDVRNWAVSVVETYKK